MAVAGSLVVNVSADASQLEQGFQKARSASKGFAADTVKDLRKQIKDAGKFEKGLNVLTGGGAAGTIAGSLLGGPAMGAALGQLDEMIGLTDTLKEKAKQVGQFFVDGFAGVKQKTIDLAEEKLQRETDAAKRFGEMERAHQLKTAGLTAFDQVTGRGGSAQDAADAADEARIRRSAHQQGTQLSKQEENLAVLMDRQEKSLQRQIEFRESNLRAAKQLAAQAEQEERARGQMVRALERENFTAGMSPLEKRKFNLDPTIVGEERARAERALEAQDRRDRAAAIQAELNKPLTDFGGTAAVQAGTSGSFSTQAKFQRLAEQQANRGGDLQRQILDVDQKHLDIAKDQRKQLEEINRALEKNDKLKLVQF